MRGGTGWGAEFAKLCNKPLFVFDQDRESLVPLDGLVVGDADRRERSRSSRIRTSPAPGRGRFGTTASEELERLFERSFTS